MQLALQTHFKKKRDHVLSRLERMGLKVTVVPQATFYVWLDLSTLPEPLNKCVQCNARQARLIESQRLDVLRGATERENNRRARHLLRDQSVPQT